MKILLINPGITKAEVYSKYSAGAPSLPPLGLCYLAAVLLENGYQVKILDCAVEHISISQLKREVLDFAPNIVGVTSTTVSYSAAKTALHTLKELDPQIITVLGGAHISALPFQTMQECKEVDIGVFGEGEYTLLDIVKRVENNQSMGNTDGVLYRSNGKIVQNKPREPVESLDSLPLPARHLLKDLRLYSHTPFRGAKFTTTMITSRGCPFNCSYCDQSVFGRRWNYHSSEYVVEEMLLLKKKYDIDFISFEDDNFLLSRPRTIEICQKILGTSLDMSWSCLGRANEVDDGLLKLLRQAGCRTIYIGIESGSPRILELINKKINMDQVRKAVELIKKHGINVMGSFILGLPTETKKDIEKTIDFALSLPLDGISFFTFNPYPNTPLRDLAFQHGEVSEEWKNYSGHPTSLPFIPDGMDEMYLLQVQAKAYRRFLIRPSYLLKHLGTFTSRRALLNGMKFLRALFSK